VFTDSLRFAEGWFQLEYSTSAATASNTRHTAGAELIVTSRNSRRNGLIRRYMSVAGCWISRRNSRGWRRLRQPNRHKVALTQRRTHPRTPVDEYFNGTTTSRLSSARVSSRPSIYAETDTIKNRSRATTVADTPPGSNRPAEWSDHSYRTRVPISNVG
jgi:hypothetical protein